MSPQRGESSLTPASPCRARSHGAPGVQRAEASERAPCAASGKWSIAARESFVSWVCWAAAYSSATPRTAPSCAGSHRRIAAANAKVPTERPAPLHSRRGNHTAYTGLGGAARTTPHPAPRLPRRNGHPPHERQHPRDRARTPHPRADRQAESTPPPSRARGRRSRVLGAPTVADRVCDPQARPGSWRCPPLSWPTPSAATTSPPPSLPPRTAPQPMRARPPRRPMSTTRPLADIEPPAAPTRPAGPRRERALGAPGAPRAGPPSRGRGNPWTYLRQITYRVTPRPEMDGRRRVPCGSHLSSAPLSAVPAWFVRSDRERSKQPVSRRNP